MMASEEHGLSSWVMYDQWVDRENEGASWKCHSKLICEMLTFPPPGHSQSWTGAFLALAMGRSV
jgi:hypothetical protein